MKKLFLILMAFVLSACANMTEREKQTAWIVGGVVVVGAIIVLSASDNATVEPCRKFFIGVDENATLVCR